jgi:hypothetical protein
MTDFKNETLKNFLNAAGIVCENIGLIDGMMIPRDILLSDERYEEVKKFIPSLKEVYSSSYMTSLQKTATSTQKWPLINIIRQILKTIDYNLTPVRISDGYTKAKKKKYKRLFKIEKMKSISNEQQEKNNIQ